MGLLTVLILHGYPICKLEDYFLTRHLEQSGYRVIAPNMFVRDYIFSPENVLAKVKDDLNGEDIDVVVGISIGGLIAPQIAKEYPNAKLVLISTGPSINSDSKVFNFFVNLVKTDFGKKIMKFAVKLPDSVLTFLYKLANPFTGDKSRREEYEVDTAKNIMFMKNIPVEEEKEIIDFISKADNSEVLKNLKNKTIIFTGENDLLMTKTGANRLNTLIEGSKIYINKGSHFDSFTEKDLETFDNFVKAN